MSWAIWISGLPGSGKSALARAAAETLRARGVPVKVLELDALRKILMPAPTGSGHEWEAVYRLLAFMAATLAEAGVPVIVDATARRRAWRQFARDLISRFAEVELECPIEVCREREAARAPGAGVPDAEEPALEELHLDLSPHQGAAETAAAASGSVEIGVV